jgi:hypothetical protein
MYKVLSAEFLPTALQQLPFSNSSAIHFPSAILFPLAILFLFKASHIKKPKVKSPKAKSKSLKQKAQSKNPKTKAQSKKSSPHPPSVSLLYPVVNMVERQVSGRGMIL